MSTSAFPLLFITLLLGSSRQSHGIKLPALLPAESQPQLHIHFPNTEHHADTPVTIDPEFMELLDVSIFSILI